MKKLILLWCLALGLSGLSYGMDKKTPEQKQDSFQKALDRKDWESVCMSFAYEQSVGVCDAFKQILLKKDITFCNELDKNKVSLFEQLWTWYLLQSYDPARQNLLGELLKDLMLKGLDFKVKTKAGYDVYKSLYEN